MFPMALPAPSFCPVLSDPEPSQRDFALLRTRMKEGTGGKGSVFSYLLEKFGGAGRNRTDA
jgi:hypothetical protein